MLGSSHSLKYTRGRLGNVGLQVRKTDRQLRLQLNDAVASWRW